MDTSERERTEHQDDVKTPLKEQVTRANEDCWQIGIRSKDTAGKRRKYAEG